MFDNKPKEAPRQSRLVAVLGAPGCGKTSYIDERIIEAVNRGHMVRALDPTGQWSKKNGAVIDGEWPDLGGADDRGPEERAEEWLRAFRKTRRGVKTPPPHCLFVPDDMDMYLGGGQPRGIWRDLFTTFRHWRCDVLCSARRTQDVPKVVFTSASAVVLFTHREVHAKEYLRQYLGAEVVERIPREPFRYIMVEVDTGKITEGRTKKRAAMTMTDAM